MLAVQFSRDKIYFMKKKKSRRRKLKSPFKILFIFILIAMIAGVATLGHHIYVAYEESKIPDAIVMIDPGHGGYDSGAIGYDGTMEKDLALSIAKKTGKKLMELNPKIQVIYTRESDEVSWPSDEVQDLRTRVKMAENQNADYFLSIHLNSNYYTGLYGYTSYVRSNDSASKQISRSVANYLDEAGWEVDLGTETTDLYPLYVVDQLEIPSLLFEAGFISNPSELEELKLDENQDLIANALANAYYQYIEEQKELEDLEEEQSK